jgi:hypothetical protein
MTDTVIVRFDEEAWLVVEEVVDCQTEFREGEDFHISGARHSLQLITCACEREKT